MAENFVQLPDDSGNTGPLVRTFKRTVNGSDVEEHFMILQDYNNNFQAEVMSGPKLQTTGLAVWSMPVGSYNIFSQSSLGSIEIYQTDNTKLFTTISGDIYIGSVSATVDSIYVQSGAVYIQSGDNILGSVGITHIDSPQTVGSYTTQQVSHLGSVEVFQLTNTNLQVQSTQETNPWIILGSNAVSNFTVLGSSRVITNFGDLGSTVVIDTPSIIGSYTASKQVLLGSTSVYNRVGGSIVNWPGSLAISNFNALGSSVVVTNFATLGSDRTGSFAITNFGVLGSSRVITEVTPIDTSKNNSQFNFEYAISGTDTGITGSRIGSIIQYIGAGSYVSVISYTNNRITNIGSWV